jgi:hypothetical protein
MTVRLINITTFLPADKRLESTLKRVMALEFKKALWHLYVPFWWGDAPIDIFLVDKLPKFKPQSLSDPRTRVEDDISLENPDQDQDRMPDTDTLGVYYPHHEGYHRPTIEVCPEQIMMAAKRICQIEDKKFTLSAAYPALFCMVVIHELAHALMDDYRTHQRQYEPWLFLTSRFDKMDFDYFDQSMACAGKASRECADCNRPRDIHLKGTLRIRHVIEESLANAIALQQNYEPIERNVIDEFVSRQSQAYKAGLKWPPSLPDLLGTASHWLNWKDLEKDLEKTYNDKTSCAGDPCLFHRLTDESQPDETKQILTEEFRLEFEKHEVL